jgi:hypothetical protein
MNIALKYLTALLGLWLIVEVNVFPAHVAHWLSFATAIAILLVALGDSIVCAVQRRVVAASTATALLAGFLIIASLVFVHASVAWLMAIAGGVIEALALSELVLPARLRIVTYAATGNGRMEQPLGRAHVAS